MECLDSIHVGGTFVEDHKVVQSLSRPASEVQNVAARMAGDELVGALRFSIGPVGPHVGPKGQLVDVSQVVTCNSDKDKVCPDEENWYIIKILDRKDQVCAGHDNLASLFPFLVQPHWGEISQDKKDTSYYCFWLIFLETTNLIGPSSALL